MKKIIKVDGMHCDHCKMRVEKALKKISGVTSAIVNLESKTAEIESSSTSFNVFKTCALLGNLDFALFKILCAFL